MQDRRVINKSSIKTPVKACHFRKMSGFLMPYGISFVGHLLSGAGVFYLGGNYGTHEQESL